MVRSRLEPTVRTLRIPTRTNLEPGEGGFTLYTYVAVDLTLLCRVMQDIILIVSQIGSLRRGGKERPAERGCEATSIHHNKRGPRLCDNSVDRNRSSAEHIFYKYPE